MTAAPTIALASQSPHTSLTNHLFDGRIAITQLLKDVACMLAETWRRPTYFSFTHVKTRGRPWLTDKSDGWLMEFDEDLPRNDLLIFDDLAPTENRTPRNVPGIEPSHPFRG